MVHDWGGKWALHNCAGAKNRGSLEPWGEKRKKNRLAEYTHKNEWFAKNFISFISWKFMSMNSSKFISMISWLLLYTINVPKPFEKGLIGF